MYIIITGASGSGKTSIIKYLKEKYNIPLSISYTTRNIRNGEEDGIDYNFVTKIKFERLIKDGKLEEYTHYNGNYYGTPKLTNDTYLFDLEYEGVLFFKNNKENCIFIFINVEKSKLISRIIDRGESKTNIEDRMIKYDKFEDLKNNVKFDHFVNNNDDLKSSLLDIELFLKEKALI